MRRIGALIALSSILACAHGASVRRGHDFRIYDTGGVRVYLLNYEDLSDRGVDSRREYDLWVTFRAAETGWGSFHHFTLELENTDAMSGANLRDFASGARVVRLTYEGMEF